MPCVVHSWHIPALRGSFMAHSFLFKRDMFVRVDETGAVHRDHIRKFGYALRGLTPTSHRILARGERINAIAAVTANGILATEIKTGTVNGVRFFDFYQRHPSTPNETLQWYKFSFSDNPG